MPKSGELYEGSYQALRNFYSHAYQLGFDALPEPVIEMKRAFFAQNDFRRAGVSFIHIPRTAGKSVMRTLYTHDQFHFTVARMLSVSFPDVCALPRFAIVRNPWDRAVSAYHFATQGGVPGWAHMNHPERYQGPKFASFETFVHEYLSQHDPRELDGVFRPQSCYVTLKDGSVPINYLGHFDKMAETEAWLSETLGRDVKFPRTNQTTRDFYPSYYNDDTRAIVGRLYQEDVDRFGFEF